MFYVLSTPVRIKDPPPRWRKVFDALMIPAVVVFVLFLASVLESAMMAKDMQAQIAFNADVARSYSVPLSIARSPEAHTECPQLRTSINDTFNTFTSMSSYDGEPIANHSMVAAMALSEAMLGYRIGCFSKPYVLHSAQHFRRAAERADFGTPMADDLMFAAPLDIWKIPRGWSSANARTRREYHSIFNARRVSLQLCNAGLERTGMNPAKAASLCFNHQTHHRAAARGGTLDSTHS